MSCRSEHQREIDQQLRDLWRRRVSLTNQEWGRLYTIVWNLLANKYTDLVAQLPGNNEDHIQDFFQDKVLALGNQGDEIHHAGALLVYYRRYLLSRLRDPYVTRCVAFGGGRSDEESARTPLDGALDDQARVADATDDPSTSRDLVDAIAALIDPLVPELGSGAGEHGIRTLIHRHLGVDLESAVRSSLDFLAGRDDWSHLAAEAWWIGLYMRCHFCPEHADAVALSTLARRHRIPSYHYKAVALGATVPKQQDAALEAFRASYRGQWLTRLGIPVDREHLLEMSLALKVLCLVALKSQEPC
jgi:hypothetical protein